jgi:hypothetical protein
MQTIDRIRLRHLGLVPPANDESAASPVTVSVKTVVVKSGTASFLTVAFRTPIARAVRRIIAYVRNSSPVFDR